MSIRRHISQRIVSLAVFAAAATIPLQAIVINDTALANYETGSGDFTGVVKILGNGGAFVCSGALISSNQVLTAGHCIAGAANWTVMFETGSGISFLGVTQGLLHPLFQPRPSPLNGLHEYDIGILTLSALAPADAQIYGVKTDYSGVTGSLLDLVGYGRGGNPSAGHLPSGTRHHAQNTIDFVISSLSLVPFPDLPIAMTLTFGEGPNNKGLAHAGDSGGPALFGNQIVGISSFGNLPRETSMLTGTMYLSGYTSLATAEIGQWVVDNTVPEPATFLLIGCALLAFSLLLRSRTSP